MKGNNCNKSFLMMLTMIDFNIIFSLPIMIFHTIIFAATIIPTPKSAKYGNEPAALAELSITCTYQNKQPCKPHVTEMINFYKKVLYPRDSPYTATQYSNLNISNIISHLTIKIQSDSKDFDISHMDESYSVNINTSIEITAQNHFGLSRALASISQLVESLQLLQTDKKAYQITLCNISDSPTYKWREQMVDAARHYLSLASLQRAIDANAILKLNVLHIRANDAASMPIAFQNNKNAAFHSRFYYSIKDLEDLQKYAFTRGVFIYLELEIPGRAAALSKIDQKYVAKCPVAALNAENVVLDVINPEVVQFVNNIFAQIVESQIFVSELFNFSVIISLAGDGFNTKCWEEDSNYKTYLKDKNFTKLEGILIEFYQKIENFVKQKNYNLRFVYNQAILQKGFTPNLNMSPIVHFTSGKVDNSLLEKGYFAITSNGWYLDVMKPGGGFFGSYADTWLELFQVKPSRNVQNLSKMLGGGGMQWGDAAWSVSFLSHMYPRAISVAEVLWADPSDRSDTWARQSAHDVAACKLYQIGVGSGPMHPGIPCLGQK